MNAEKVSRVPVPPEGASPRSRRGFFVFAAVLFAAWLPYVVFCFPGNVTFDTGTSILLHWGVETANQDNPFFQTLLFGLVADFGRLIGNMNLAVFLFCFLQLLLEIAVLSDLLCFLRDRWNVPLPAVLFILAVFALVPVFPLTAFTMGKDSDFALVMLFFIRLSFGIIDDAPAFFSVRRNRIFFILTAVLLSLMRNYAALVVLPGLLAWLRCRRDRSRVMVRSVLLAVAGVVAITAVVPAVFSVPRPRRQESLSLPLQTTAIYLLEYPDDLTQEEKDLMEDIFPGSALRRYRPDIVDPLKNASGLTDANADPFLRVWASLMLRHPLVLLKGLWRGTSAYWNPFQHTDVKPHAQLGFVLKDYVKETLGLRDGNPDLLALARRLDDLSLSVPVLSVFAKIGLYTLLLLASLIFSVCKEEQGRKSFLLCVLPLLAVFLGCLFSPVNGYYRYAYTYIVAVPFVFTGLLSPRFSPFGRTRTQSPSR